MGDVGVVMISVRVWKQKQKWGVFLLMMIGGAQNKQIFSLCLLVGIFPTVAGETEGAEMLGSGYYRGNISVDMFTKGVEGANEKNIEQDKHFTL